MTRTHERKNLFHLKFFQIIAERHRLHWTAFDRSVGKDDYEQIQCACVWNGGKLGYLFRAPGLI